jgi:hypothetical protein
MTAVTLEQIMQGIEGRLATIEGLRTNDIAPDQINPPVAIVGVPPVPEYHATMQMGTFRVAATVTVLVSAALDRVGQLKLAGYANPAGSTSIRAAVEADKTLGGLSGVNCIVRSFRPLGLEEVGVIGYYGGVFELFVIASGA